MFAYARVRFVGIYRVRRQLYFVPQRTYSHSLHDATGSGYRSDNLGGDDGRG